MADRKSRSDGGSQSRARAARILVGILHQGKTIDQSFGLEHETGRSNDEGTALQQALIYGTLRHYFTLEPLVAAHLSRDFRSKDLDLRCLLLVGAYQLFYMRIPAHAAINETVAACRSLRKPWARGLINAVLRKLSNQDWAEHSFGLPDWIVELLSDAYPEDAQAVMAATLDRAPMSLRVNLSRTTPEVCLSQLEAAGIAAHPGWRAENLILEQPLPARSIPGFPEGLLSIQDAGALFAAPLVVERAPAGRILDACAAPGGKLFHMAELAPSARLVGVEVSPNRLAHMQSEADRLGHSRIDLRLGDATDTAWHQDTTGFDAILLDAPCSGSGTLRRHPDIKILRQPSDIAEYVKLQSRLLKNLWQLLVPGGQLVYCTCSLFPAENDDVVESFLSSEPSAQIQTFTLPVGRATRHGWQLVPLPADPGSPGKANRTVDGFYFARMTRREEAR